MICFIEFGGQFNEAFINSTYVTNSFDVEELAWKIVWVRRNCKYHSQEFNKYFSRYYLKSVKLLKIFSLSFYIYTIHLFRIKHCILRLWIICLYTYLTTLYIYQLIYNLYIIQHICRYYIWVYKIMYYYCHFHCKFN